jgi:hypothetical protein
MKQKIHNTSGKLFQLDRRGKRIAVDYFYAPTDDECGCGIFCCEGEDAYIRFKHSELGMTDLPLEQLYNFMVDNGFTDVTAPTTPSDFVITDTFSNGFSVSWTDGSALDPNLVRYGLTLNGVLVTTMAANANDGTLTYDFVDLTSETNYTIGIYAEDAAGNNSIAATINSNTDAVQPVTTLAENAVAATTIDITWDAYTSDDIDGVESVSLRIAEDGNTPVEVDTALASAAAYQFTGLTTATAYDIAVIVVDSDGNESVAATLDSTTA